MADYKDFSKRWNIPIDDRDIFNKFKVGLINHIRNSLSDYWDEELDANFCLEAYIIYKSSIISSDIFESEFITSSNMFLAFGRVEDNVKLIFYLQCLLSIMKGRGGYKGLIKGLRKLISNLPININLKETKNEVIIYPEGAELIDHEVVDTILDWLNSYPDVKGAFKSALEKYQSKKYQRNILDDLRLALETLLKKVLSSDKNLEKLKEPFFKYTKGKKVPKEIRNMFWQLTSYYSEYQNRYVKHKDKVDAREIEFIFYLTGTFIRYLIIIQEENFQ